MTRASLTPLVLALVCLAVPAAASAAPAVELLAPVAPDLGQLSEKQGRFLSELRARPSLDAPHLVQLAADPASIEGPVTLTPLPSVTVQLTETRVERRSATDYTWIGTRPGRAEQAILVVNGEHVTGSVTKGGEYYQLRPLGDGLIAAARVDPSAFPAEHPPEFASLTAPTRVPLEKAAGCSYVDLVVAYTNDAGAAVADIYGLAQLAVAETNQSYANSGIVHRVRMVHFYGTNYDDSGNMTRDRDRFRIDGDGHMDEIHLLRDAFGGDVAVLITDAGFYCGIAADIYASSSTAFAVVAQNCATGYYSFGHEIGHLHGARHNTQADPTNTPFPYGHGYYNSADGWRTVMSYNCPGGCTRIPYWSNPYVTYGGDPMGTVSTNDNHRVLNETCNHVAGFK